MTKKAVVYYRTRSEEPEISELALEAQRKKVSKYVEDEGYLIVGEYTDDESLEASFAAYISAVRLAGSLAREDDSRANLIIATDEPIGSGAALRLPEKMSDEDALILHHVLSGPLQPFPPTMQLRGDAPDCVCLFVAYRASPTLAIYLCNPTREALRNVKVTSTTLFTGDVFFPVSGPLGSRSFKEVGLEQISVGDCEVRTWDLVPARTSVLVGSVYTNFNDAIPWYLIEHSDEHGMSTSLYGNLFALDPANPFHTCVPGTTSAA